MNILNLKKKDILLVLFNSMLFTIPFPFIINSISLILFSIFYIYYYRDNFIFCFNFYLFLPISYFILVLILCLLFQNENLFFGIKKNIPFLVIPLFFLNASFVKEVDIKTVLKHYSFSFLLVALYFILNAFYCFLLTKDRELFFFQKLVGIDQNAIYVSVYASIAMFYFYSKNNKTILDRISLVFLLFFIFLLSSKTVIFIDILLSIIYYFFFSKKNKSVRVLTFVCGFLFILFSCYFVPQVNKRVLEEYETAFVDNTINDLYSNTKQKTYNVSLKDAYYNKSFKKNQFFPGTAYRVFHIRLFKEIMNKKKEWFRGLGINNTDLLLHEKYLKYNVFLNQNYFNFHNQYVQSFAELGLIGLIIVVLMVFFNVYNAIQKQSFLHLAFAFMMLVFFLTEVFLIRQRGIMFFVSFYCIFNVYKNKNLKE
ncbi:O-antigen ligase-like membrane protein [Flavobacterium croceum DSM 17960]|uniref:O-antigen ligase-like membrane protein n=1 Tax=Flavobacterium croceum DSM 17960 TaxID=1121886 RepID=A0A2S4NB98_9FLAO|nr:O-antigen ligase family protein [Flavobacterium croceum]POS02986.1 O-antigen ligase-like membrane protein [Flavobacterium croceum DSM 17960]